jgi:hypothetical protein
VTRPRCAALTAAGRPCRNRARPSAPFCRQHEPPAECIGGPWDGVALAPREARLPIVVGVRLPSGELEVHRFCVSPPGEVIGIYRLRYDGLVPVWLWERTAVDSRVCS